MYAVMAYMRSLLVLLLFAAPIARAAEVTRLNVYPSHPTNTTAVTLAYSGWGADAGDGAGGPRVTVDGFRILVEFGRGDGCCLSAMMPWDARVSLGMLPAGNYEVIASLPSYGGRHEHRSSFVVRDVTGVPFDAPAARAQTDELTMVDWRYGEIVRLDVGGRETEAGYTYDGFACYCAFRRERGLYDVQATWEDGATKLVRNAFEVYEERDGVPPILERFLVPVHFQGPGGAGSRWESELTISTSRPGIAIPGIVPEVFLRRGAPHYDFIAEPGQRRSGFVFGLPYRAAGDYGIRLRVRDASRGERWTPVPVVRERDFFTRPVYARELPYAPGTRLMLRMYVLDRKNAAFRVSASSRTIDVAGARNDPFAPAYAELDLSAIRQEGTWPGVAVETLDGAPFWSFVTATDTATGAVSVIELADK